MSRQIYTISSLAGLASALDAGDGGTILEDPPAPPKKKMPGDGYPPGVTASRSSWTEDEQYRLSSGETISGIARTYLGDPARWKEIWNLQPTNLRMTRSADNVPVGTLLEMPEDAKKRARELGVLGVSPDTKNGIKWAAAAAAAVLLVGGGIALVRSR